MKHLLRVVLLSACSAIWAGPALAENSAPSAAASAKARAPAPINWQSGPVDMLLLNQARVRLPQTYAFLAQEDARKLLRKMGNPNIEDVLGLMSGPGGKWIVVVRFEKTGYIRDDAAQDWKADELLLSLNQSIKKTNAIRRKSKVSELAIVGWMEQPHYEKPKHRLIWSVVSQDKKNTKTQDQDINYNIHALGREGVISFNLVGDLIQIEQNKLHVAALLAGFDFVDGKKYSDFNSVTDAIAPYGLTALVTGAPSHSASTMKALAHFFARFGMIIAWALLGIIAVVGAVMGTLFMRRRRAARSAEPEPAPDEKTEPEMNQPEAAAPA